MNIIELAGRLGADPEARFTSSGQKVITMRIATTTRKNGKDETLWWRAVIWGDRYDKLIQYFKKGSAIIVVGELGKPEIYQDKQGNNQISLEVTVEMLRFSPFGKSESNENPSVNTQQSSKPVIQNGMKEKDEAEVNMYNDNLPF